MDNFWSSLRQAFGHLGTIRVMDIVDILLVAAFFYFLITLVRRTKTNKLFQGIVYILLALWLSGEMQLYTVNYILRNAVQVGLLALVVLFQPFLDPRTASMLRRFVEGGGKLLWMSIYPLLTPDGADASAAFRSLFGIRSIDNAYAPVKAKGKSVKFVGTFAGIADMTILND